MQKSWFGKLSCSVLLLTLAGLQVQHMQFLLYGNDLFSARSYIVLLFVAPPAFYFFSREILAPGSKPGWLDVLNGVPVAVGLLVPTDRFESAAAVAFTVGAGYTLWFARLVFRMRRHVGRFRFEMFFFGLFAVQAVLILVIGLTIPQLGADFFFVAYANFIGVTLLLVVAALIVFPYLLEDIADAAALPYASSTLGDVDVPAKLIELDRQMREEAVFEDSDLSLPGLADRLDLSTHQLSELINSHFGYGFSRYVREHRVAAAKRLLETDERSSVLAIGLMTGFRSQSNFYAAFRELTGIAPGEYRKLQRKP